MSLTFPRLKFIEKFLSEDGDRRHLASPLRDAVRDAASSEGDALFSLFLG
jgi:hypothetical protein